MLAVYWVFNGTSYRHYSTYCQAGIILKLDLGGVVIYVRYLNESIRHKINYRAG